MTVQQAFQGPLRLKERLGTIDAKKIAKTYPGKPSSCSGRGRDPPLPRLDGGPRARPGGFVADEYGGDAERIWTEAEDAADLKRRTGELPGFGDMKIRGLSAVLAKRFGVPAAQELRRATRRSATSTRSRRSTATRRPSARTRPRSAARPSHPAVFTAKSTKRIVAARGPAGSARYAASAPPSSPPTAELPAPRAAAASFVVCLRVPRA